MFPSHSHSDMKKEVGRILTIWKIFWRFQKLSELLCAWVRGRLNGCQGVHFVFLSFCWYRNLELCGRNLAETHSFILTFICKTWFLNCLVTKTQFGGV